MLLTFFVILFFIFILMLIGGILGYVFRNQVDDRMNREMISTVALYNNDTAVTEAWDSVQKNFRCCGISVNGAKGYQIYQRQNRPSFGGGTGKDKVPKSCCKDPNGNQERTCTQTPDDPLQVYQEDCYAKMKDFVKYN
ncbi:unnamed protein product [Oppiella nova]|uniref:Tetraspanin n=1 Tax=Oppiella nova TaxID=334625 RepID=A0A7R9MNN1_9ACAR|nr:unnamed protein product [Oppiella nova]CAG2180329.1 unnamed protein product [Oppiella nova]